ncbi:hypothetical protein [Pseudogemmobacter bohemicus]|uniref:hypothetical protein n=1 Tax=Pseudogemmobacter bohemicus TaxID=2250708 RepID=UPI000DD48228|nr:hypothetical protein [Pseudogemmobacter bohemicus]
MDGQAESGLESYVIWGLIATIWLSATWFVLKQLCNSRGTMRFVLFVSGALMVAIAAAPLWFVVMLMLMAMGTSGPEGPVGIGSAAIVSGAVLGGITGLVLTMVVMMRKRPEVAGT